MNKQNSANHPFSSLFSSFSALLKTNKALLHPENGCPWDLKQTHESLKSCLIEEAYEVCEAIEKNDHENLKEELGDLLYQIIFHANLAEKAGVFSLQDVVEGINQKLIRRHPHIFSDAAGGDAEQITKNWEKIKKEEKEKKGIQKAFLDGIPKSLPALEKAYQVQVKMNKVGFQWKKMEDLFGKLREELQEFEEAVTEKELPHIEEELGDFLFMMANVAMVHNIQPEKSLQKSIEKCISRFHYIEEELAKEGVSLSDASLEKMDALWNEAKKRE